MKAVSKRRGSARKRKTAFRPLLLLFRLVVVLSLAGALWCVYVYSLIGSYEAEANYAEADAAIVLGAALWNNKPSPALKERLNHALKLYEAGTVEWLILSGGHGGLSSSISEAEGMRDYLVSRGVAEDKLLLESKAGNTYQNVVFSDEIAKERGLDSFIIVTHDYHAARAGEIADFIQLGQASVAGVKSLVLNSFYNETREVLAFTKWRLDKLLYFVGFRSHL